MGTTWTAERQDAGDECPGCDHPALDGHVTCGEVPCSELERRGRTVTKVKLRKIARGAHVVVDVFVGSTAGSLGNAGSLIMDHDEWILFAAAISKGARRMWALEVAIDGDPALAIALLR